MKSNENNSVANQFPTKTQRTQINFVGFLSGISGLVGKYFQSEIINIPGLFSGNGMS